MKKRMILFACLTCFLFSNADTQEKYTISGIVVEKGTEKPVQDMAVFIPYSAIGTTSSSDGSFNLSKIPKGKHEIHFRHLGYEVSIMDFETGKSDSLNVVVYVSPHTIEFDEVSLTGDPSKRNAYLKIFNQYFLGDVSGLSCYLQNQDDLYFFIRDNILIASSHKPLIIINKRFGYKIKFYLDDFKFMNPFGKDINPEEQFYSFAGSPLYEKIEAKNYIRNLNWEKNREDAFEGSQRHFFISLKTNRLSKNRYLIREINHSLESAFQSVGMSENEILNPDIVIDSIFDWGSSNTELYTYYYFPLLDYPDLIYPDIDGNSLEFIVPDSILIFHNRYNTVSMKDDQAILLYVESGKIEIGNNEVSSHGEGDLLWKLIGNSRTLRSILPIDYMPEKYFQKQKRRRK